VSEDGRTAHQLVFLVNNHRDATSRILREISQLFVLTLEYVDFFEFVVDAGDVEEREDSASVAIVVMPVNLQLPLLHEALGDLLRGQLSTAH